MSLCWIIGLMTRRKKFIFMAHMENSIITVDLNHYMLACFQSRHTRNIGSKTLDEEYVHKPSNAIVKISSSLGQYEESKDV